jgi:hypothetical protein
MLRQYKPHQIIKTVAASGTPEFLDDNNTRIFGATFIGEKAFNTPNTGNVTIQVEGGDALLLEPGEMITWPQPPYEAGYWMPQDFKIKVATNGDGVRCLTNILL